MFCKALILCIFVLTGAGYSNDANLGSEGGNVFPLHHSTIRMKAENVHVFLTWDSIRVECRFVFVNDGARDFVLMGFPALSCTDMDVAPIRNFSTTVDGNPVTVNYIETPDTLECRECSHGRAWYTWPVVLQERETTMVANQYSGDIGISMGGTVSSSYMVGTGATWQGPIGSGRVVFVHGRIASSLFRLNGENASVTDTSIKVREYRDSIVYSFKDYEPRCNEGLTVSLVGFKAFSSPRFTLGDYLRSEIKAKKHTAREL